MAIQISSNKFQPIPDSISHAGLLPKGPSLDEIRVYFPDAYEYQPHVICVKEEVLEDGEKAGFFMSSSLWKSIQENPNDRSKWWPATLRRFE
jgi:hypothetical protein